MCVPVCVCVCVFCCVPALQGCFLSVTVIEQPISPLPRPRAQLCVCVRDCDRRGPTNPGEVLVHGVRCPIRGRVSMEKTVVGVQHLVDAGVHVRIGDEVVLLGQVSVWGRFSSADLVMR